MKRDFIWLSWEEILDFCPEVYSCIDVRGYAMETDSGRVATAIFYQEPGREDEAVLYRFMVMKDGLEWKNNFFKKCFSLLQQDSYRTVYFRSTGTEEELMVRHDGLVELGFEPLVYMGTELNYRLSELLSVPFMDSVRSEQTEGYETFLIDNDLPDEAVSFINSMEADELGTSNVFYNPAFSVVCLGKEGDGGVLCMNLSGTDLYQTVLALRSKEKEHAKVIFKVLLNRLLSSAGEMLPGNSRLGFTINQICIQKELEKTFAGKGEIINYQEFLLQLED